MASPSSPASTSSAFKVRETSRRVVRSMYRPPTSPPRAPRARMRRYARLTF